MSDTPTRDDQADWVDVDLVPDDDGGTPSVIPIQDVDRYKLEIGVPITASLWFHNEDRARQHAIAKSGIRLGLGILAKQKSLILGPVKWAEYTPEDAGVPEPPDWMQGEVKVLAGTAKVLAITEQALAPTRFSREIDLVSLMTLRKATKDRYAAMYPHRPPLSDDEADLVIDEHGERTMQRRIVGTVHNDRRS